MSHTGPEFYVLTLVPFIVGFILGALALRVGQRCAALRRDERDLEHAQRARAAMSPRSIR